MADESKKAEKKQPKKNALQAFKEAQRKEPTVDELKRTIRDQRKYIKALEEELAKYDAR